MRENAKNIADVSERRQLDLQQERKKLTNFLRRTLRLDVIGRDAD